MSMSIKVVSISIEEKIWTTVKKKVYSLYLTVKVPLTTYPYYSLSSQHIPYFVVECHGLCRFLGFPRVIWRSLLFLWSLRRL